MPPYEQLKSKAIGRLLRRMATTLQNLRTDSDGGALVLDRVATDLEWLSGKFIKGDYTAQAPNHQLTALVANLQELGMSKDDLLELLLGAKDGSA